MSLWTSIKNLFGNLGPRNNSDHDGETHADGPPKGRSTHGLFFSRLAKISLKRHSEENKATDSVTSHTGPSPSYQRSGESSSTPTFASTSSSITPPPSDSSSSRESSFSESSYQGSETTAEYEERTAKQHALFKDPDPATRAQRRKALYRLPREKICYAARWLSTHPEDLWDTPEEQEANFSRMRADGRVKRAEWEDRHGLEDLLEDRPEEYKRLRKRAKVVGWYAALQESVFREEWCAEGGMFGEKGSGGPLPEEVGPMGETM